MALKLLVLLSIFSSQVFATASLRSLAPTDHLRFYYQPHESEGTSCVHKPTGQPHGYLVFCGDREFQIHHFARPYKRSNELSWEVLYWVTNRRSNKANEYIGTSLWLNAKPDSKMTSFKISQAVDEDTATLDLTIDLSSQP